MHYSYQSAQWGCGSVIFSRWPNFEILILYQKKLLSETKIEIIIDSSIDCTTSVTSTNSSIQLQISEEATGTTVLEITGTDGSESESEASCSAFLSDISVITCGLQLEIKCLPGLPFRCLVLHGISYMAL